MTSLFRPADELLTQYARYHRDRRNITTHFIGVPMIIFGLGVLLAWPAATVGSVLLTPAWVLFVPVSLWYLTRGRPGLGLATATMVGGLLALAHPLGAESTAVWLAAGVGAFVVGWIIQFVGHWYEGRKPAFADDLVGLLVGPMFVVLELLAPTGWFRALMDRIEREAGPTYLRDLAHPA